MLNLNIAVVWYVLSENFIFKITVHSIFTSTQYSLIWLSLSTLNHISWRNPIINNPRHLFPHCTTNFCLAKFRQEYLTIRIARYFPIGPWGNNNSPFDLRVQVSTAKVGLLFLISTGSKSYALVLRSSTFAKQNKMGESIVDLNVVDDVGDLYWL